MSQENNGEAQCLALLAKVTGAAPEVHEHAVVTTVDAWAPIVAALPTPALCAKNMFLKGKKGEQVLVFALATTKTDMGLVQAAAGSNNLRFAPEELLTATLGVAQGAVTPLALVNDAKKAITAVCIDSNVVAAELPLAVHPCRNDRTVLVTAAQLQAYFAALDITPKIVDFSAAPAPKPAAAPAGPAQPKAAKAAKPAKEPKANVKGETKLGVDVKKADNFPEWYSQVITKSDMLEYYDVSGCYILRPWAYEIWEHIKNFLDYEIKEIGVENCYFPMFVSAAVLEREKNHIEGFAPEVAWVTKAGSGDLAEPVAIRPTSETVMYPSFAKWIRSHRDLPLKINQWCNVVRWEFSHPTPFIRTREFLWQEGHTAHADKQGADAEVRTILDLYRQVYEDLLAVPVVCGVKTEKEKFAGGDYTTTTEAFIPTVGRACQGATSHALGQNFGKMFHIEYESPAADGTKLIPFQNSWGMTTRTIGIMVMVHGDDQGLVLPPKVAAIQVVIMPVGITVKSTQAERDALVDACQALHKTLRAAGIRSKADVRDNVSPGWKFNHWELKGVPLRVEIGPNELAKKELVVCQRKDKKKSSVAWDGNVDQAMVAHLKAYQAEMFAAASGARNELQATVTAWPDFVPALNRRCSIMSPWCGAMACEDAIKKDSANESKAAMAEAKEDERAPSMGAKSLCIPFTQPALPEGTLCIRNGCKHAAKDWVMFGRSY
jgi:prolyl-tRNA synthetase